MYPGMKFKMSLSELKGFYCALKMASPSFEEPLERFATMDICGDILLSLGKKICFNRPTYSFTLKPSQIWFIKLLFENTIFPNESYEATISQNVLFDINKFQVNLSSNMSYNYGLLKQ